MFVCAFFFVRLVAPSHSFVRFFAVSQRNGDPHTGGGKKQQLCKLPMLLKRALMGAMPRVNASVF